MDNISHILGNIVDQIPDTEQQEDVESIESESSTETFSQITLPENNRYHSDAEEDHYESDIDRDDYRETMNMTPDDLDTDKIASIKKVEEWRRKKRKEWTLYPIEEEERASREKVVQAQLQDEQTQDIVNCIREGVEITYREIRPRTPYIRDLIENKLNLRIVDEELRYRTLTKNGGEIDLLVVPENMREEIVKDFHQKYSHTHPWRLQNLISRHYHILNLKTISKKIYKECQACTLSAAPNVERARKLNVFNTRPTEELSIDLLTLPMDDGKQYLLVAIDMGTSFIFAEALKTKSAEDVAEALMMIFQKNVFISHKISSDLGTEFCNAVFEKMTKFAHIAHIKLEKLEKDCVLAESANSRILNLLRRELEKEKGWTKAINAITFALNACEKKYGTKIFTPAELFNGREPEIPGDNFESDIETDTIGKSQKIRKYMTEIAKSRNLGMNNLYLSAKNKPRTYTTGQRVLVWRQFVLKKRLLKNGILAAKLSRFWSVARVIKKLGEKYRIRTEEGDERTVHRRQMKPFKPEEE
jgi:hypothetical protein